MTIVIVAFALAYSHLCYDICYAFVNAVWAASGVTGQKKHFFCQKQPFYGGCPSGSKKNIFCSQKKPFCVSTCFYSLDGINSGQKKHLFVVKKNLCACPWVPSSLEGVHSSQKESLFLVKKNIFVCPWGSSSLESVHWGVSTGSL